MKLGRRLSLGEYKQAVSWSKYIMPSNVAIKGKARGIECIYPNYSLDPNSLLMYKHMDVAIKLISQPNEDEDLPVLLEKQLTSDYDGSGGCRKVVDGEHVVVWWRMHQLPGFLSIPSNF